MHRKRIFEALAVTLLLLVLGAIGGGFAYVHRLNIAFAEALDRGDGETACVLLRTGVACVRVDALKGRDRQEIFIAVRSGNPAFVEQVLSRGEEVNARRMDELTPSMAAAVSGRAAGPSVARILIEPGSQSYP